MVSSDWLSSLNVNDYVIEKYTPAKRSETALTIFFLNRKDEKLASEHEQQKCKILPFCRSGSELISLPIKEANMIVSENSEANIKSVFQITLDAMSLNTSNCMPGDTIGIVPVNRCNEVQDLLHHTGLEDKADQMCRVAINPKCIKKNVKFPVHIPEVTTPRRIIRDCLNLHAIIKKQFLSALADCCSDEVESAFLKCLSSKESTQNYNYFFLEKKLTLLAILVLCPSCKPSLEILIEYLPRLLPRPYSIANSPSTSNSGISFIFSVNPDNPGVTTLMLSKLIKSMEESTIVSVPKVLIYLRDTNKFRYTQDDITSNQILIAVGTAVSPFLGFLEHKENLSSQCGSTIGETWLFVGAATENCIPHRQRILRWHSNGVLNKYFESTSRIPDATYHYVHDQIKHNAKDVVEFLLQKHTTLYVCADGARISKSIEATLRDSLCTELNITDPEALLLIQDFRKLGKYCEDLWT